MSKLSATVVSVIAHEMLSIVTFDVWGHTVQMMSLDMQKRLHEGDKVVLGIKPWSVALVHKKVEKSSFANQVSVKVVQIEKGELLVRFMLEVGEERLESVILRQNATDLALHEGDDVVAVIPAGDISVVELTDV